MTWLRDSVLTALLFVLYVGMFLPWRLLSRVVRDPLHRRLDRTAVSYWTLVAAPGGEIRVDQHR